MSEKDPPSNNRSNDKSTRRYDSPGTTGTTSRRRWLHLLGAGSLAGIAGCPGDDTDAGGNGDQDSEGDTDAGGDGDRALQESVTIGATALSYHNFWGLSALTRAFEPLVAYDQEMKPIPWLATDWERTDEDLWEFTLRDGVTYHNGDQLTADKVISRANRWLSEADWVTEPGGINTTAEGISKVDEMTIEMKTIEPDARQYVNLVEVKTFGAHPDGPPRFMETYENLIGTGPFQFEEAVEDQYVEMSAFDDYWGGNPESDGPHVEEMTVRAFEDRNTAALALLGEEVDVALELPVSQVDAIESGEDTKIETQTKSSTTELRVNLEAEPTSDSDLRKALNYAIDRDQLIEATQNGLAVPAKGTLAPVYWAAAYDSLPDYGHDTDRASELVEESSYDGETLEYVTTEETPRSSTLVAEVIQQSFDEIGVNMQIQTVGSSTWSERISAGDGHLFTNTEWLNFMGEFFSEVRRFGSPEGGIYFHEHPTNEPKQEVKDELDPLIAEAMTSTGETYKELLLEIQLIIMEEALLVPLFHQQYLVGMRTGIEEVDWHPALTSTRTENLKYFE